MRLIITHRMWDSKYGYAPIPDIGVMPIRPRIVRTTLVKVSRYAKSNAYFTQVSRAGYAQRSRRSRRACRRRLARRLSSPMCFASTDTGARPCTGRAQFRTSAEAKRQQVAVCSNHLLRMEFR